jgi:hypothetical protein
MDLLREALSHTVGIIIATVVIAVAGVVWGWRAWVAQHPGAIALSTAFLTSALTTSVVLLVVGVSSVVPKTGWAQLPPDPPGNPREFDPSCLYRAQLRNEEPRGTIETIYLHPKRRGMTYFYEVNQKEIVATLGHTVDDKVKETHRASVSVLVDYKQKNTFILPQCRHGRRYLCA